MEKKIPRIGRVDTAKMSIKLDASKNPCRLCVLACWAAIEKATKLDMEMRQIGDAQGTPEEGNKAGRVRPANGNACDEAGY